MSFSVPPQHQTNPAKAPGVIRNDVTLGDYIKRLTVDVQPGPTALYERGWNAALEMVSKHVNTLYPFTVLEESDRMWCAALDNVTQVLAKEKK